MVDLPPVQPGDFHVHAVRYTLLSNASARQRFTTFQAAHLTLDNVTCMSAVQLRWLLLEVLVQERPVLRVFSAQ